MPAQPELGATLQAGKRPPSSRATKCRSRNNSQEQWCADGLLLAAHLPACLRPPPLAPRLRHGSRCHALRGAASPSRRSHAAAADAAARRARLTRPCGSRPAQVSASNAQKRRIVADKKNDANVDKRGMVQDPSIEVRARRRRLRPSARRARPSCTPDSCSARGVRPRVCAAEEGADIGGAAPDGLHLLRHRRLVSAADHQCVEAWLVS